MTDQQEAPPGWLTISALARERGVNKSAISRRVARFEEQGRLVTRAIGKTKIVNLAEFDRAAAETVDAVRELNANAAKAAPEPTPTASSDPVLAHEQARRAVYAADLARLDYEERIGKLVDADAVRSRVTECALELAAIADGLPGQAEALMNVALQDGASGLRTALRATSRELRASLARAAEAFAKSSPADDAKEAA